MKRNRDNNMDAFSGMPDPQTYLQKRKKDPILKYRMNRRLRKITATIRQWKDTCDPQKGTSATGSHQSGQAGLCVLDVGAADGQFLTLLKNRLPVGMAVGIEPSARLREACQDSSLLLIPGEGEYLPLKNRSMDVVVVASVIEHVADAGMLIQECHRVLNKGGLLVVSAVDPCFDRIVTRLGFKRDDHVKTFTPEQLRALLEKTGFRITAAEKFGLISLGLLPFEENLEKCFNKLRFNFTMYYHLGAGIKTD